MLSRLNGRLPASPVCDSSPRDLRVCYETEALTMDRLNELLSLAVIAENLARRLDPAGHRRLRDDAPIPHLLNDLVLGYQALSVIHQQREQCQTLEARRQTSSARAKLHLGRIQLERAESVNHGSQDRTTPDNLPEISMVSTCSLQAWAPGACSTPITGDGAVPAPYSSLKEK